MDVAVISVTYNSGHHIVPWAASLQAAWQRLPSADRGRLDAIVVDNGSTDGTVNALRREARWVEVLPAGRNTGFAAACNTGLGRVADDAVIVLLNPDVQVDEHFFAVLKEIDWPEDLAAVGPRVIGKDGGLEQSARRFPTAWTGLVGRQAFLSRAFPSMSLVRRELLASIDGGGRFVDWISGACMVSKPHVFRQVGGFDESYFMYWEDADWCQRAAFAGLRVRYEPRLVVRHDQGASSGAFPVRTVVHFHRSALRYYRTHVSRSPVESGFAAAALTARGLVKLAAAALCLLGQCGRRRPSAAITDASHDVTTRDDPDRSPLDVDEGPQGCASIVIVTWNSEVEIAVLLESIAEQLDASWEVFVVDNASTDGTLAQVRRSSLPVHLTCLDENIGFGAANNLALRSVSTPGTVLLNPDTVLVDDSLGDLVRLSIKANGIVGPRLLNEDLSVQPSASCRPASLKGTLRIFLPGRAMPARWASMLEPWRARTTISAGWVSGACIAAPTALLRRLGPFDEAIHLYGEDLDLGLRADALRIPRLFAPDVARVVHLGDRSSGQRFSDAGLALSVQTRRAVVRMRLGRARETWDDMNELGLTLTRLAGKRLIGADTARQRAWFRARYIGRLSRR